jgi:predicted RNA binding protein with dsRBD fold (UPF0201 family)
MLDDYTIDIIDMSDINLWFIRANSALITQHKEELLSQQLTDDARKELLESLWNSVYKVQILKDNNSWVKVKFSNERSMMLFKLQWC